MSDAVVRYTLPEILEALRTQAQPGTIIDDARLRIVFEERTSCDGYVMVPVFEVYW